MRTGPGLFERITGHFADGSTVSDFTPENQTFLSVRDNIERILNSRRRSLAHLPDYGLDDLSEIYRHLPSSTHKLRNAIEATLLKYEPRLKAVEIQVHAPEPGMMVGFTMACRLHQEGLVRFDTVFTPDGKTRLKMLQAALDRY
ncbi:MULTISPECIES: type VI secretion system baseplate subunit TssE [unclassified Caballeronia]|uniref:type VI secretion system baseplate subunit TssE n=1 Tax=unclassified Caballeronia TaxID=2646786 RepID=UPI0028575970|nr:MULTISPECIES: type VI secretion system baseplate subunit TssE [unclassified Caballeronia]MDR5753055.1 type VI secretion system baseplate subunit TssE [Caballeronia sp. LZ024]MDR5841938.1 type VI secretion system baseplate subunit TssE [Caballeronia sp. LZ031]